MGKFLGYYCPFCGKEYSSFYENTVCQNCASVLYSRYDYFPSRKIKSKIRNLEKESDLLEDIIPQTGIGRRKSNFEETSLIKVDQYNDKNISVYIKNEAEHASGCIAERGLNYIFPGLKSKKSAGALFYDEGIYSAVFLKIQYEIDLKLLIPDFLGEENINNIFLMTDNVDVVEEKDVFLNLFKFDSKSFIHSLSDFKYIEGLKRIFFEIISKFSINEKIHVVIPGNSIELILAWGKAFQELKLLSIIKPKNFILHCYIDNNQMGPVQEQFLKQFKKQIFSMVKESGGSVLQVGRDELEIDISRKKMEIGLPLGYSALTSLVVSGLLIDKSKIKPSEKIVCINQNHAYLDFIRN